VVEAHEQRFRRFLSERGLNFTRGRRAILDCVFASDWHFDPKELLGKLRRGGARVSRATLYRTLALLVESGLLEEVSLGEEHRHYEHMLGHEHHDHLVCTACGRVIEFSSPAIERLQGSICREHRFRASGHRLRIFGYCARCAKPPSRPARARARAPTR
jgi:Fur family ferric uptake transcriptional regulator